MPRSALVGSFITVQEHTELDMHSERRRQVGCSLRARAEILHLTAPKTRKLYQCLACKNGRARRRRIVARPFRRVTVMRGLVHS
jgi:hypothetical protein